MLTITNEIYQQLISRFGQNLTFSLCLSKDNHTPEDLDNLIIFSNDIKFLCELLNIDKNDLFIYNEHDDNYIIKHVDLNKQVFKNNADCFFCSSLFKIKHIDWFNDSVIIFNSDQELTTSIQNISYAPMIHIKNS